ncbi:hypothetical protein ACTOB_007355 [Actinoplanes oblitus]|uniref:Uncharacterized protein n=1 Tax=Actinoplanes oblitus TaxID=3040509 RepID=A0ABY8WDY0_9ACTN|nr:hypothetical protein [Actinoplanes oblitus]WIM95268.1 hypothetical protein ACTOB_007355 [Actinoplanes oblitus]
MDKMEQNTAKRADRPVLLGVGRGLLPRQRSARVQPVADAARRDTEGARTEA